MSASERMGEHDDSAPYDDAELLSKLGVSDRVFWAGTRPPRHDFVASQRIFEPDMDFRESAIHHGSFSTVYLVEQDLGRFNQWPLILDEALRLLRYREKSAIFIRFSESQFLTIFAFAAFLRRREDFELDLIYQRQYPNGITTYAISCRRKGTAPALRTFEFALITDGRRPNEVVRFITSVGQVAGISEIDWNIAICGPHVVAESIGRRLCAPLRQRIRFIDEPDENTEKGWISRKKNLIVATSSAENLLIAHDRYSIPPSFLRNISLFGADFSVVVPAQIDGEGQRFPDWVATGSQWGWAPARFLPYGSYSPDLYVNGGMIIAKRETLARCPWNDFLFWNQGEDVELTRRMTERGVTPRLARSIEVLVTAARPGYAFGFRHASEEDGESIFPIGKRLDLRGTDTRPLRSSGVTIAHDDWRPSKSGLVATRVPAALVLGFRHYGGSTYLEIDCPKNIDVTLLEVRANGAPIHFHWRWIEESFQRGNALLDNVVQFSLPELVLSFISEKPFVLSAITLSPGRTTQSYPIRLNRKDENALAILAGGWSVPEPWGIWSEASEAVLILPLPDKHGGQDLRLVLTLIAHGPTGDFEQIVGVTCNSIAVGNLHIPVGRKPRRYAIRVPGRLIKTAAQLDVALRPAFPSSPLEAGTSSDPRRLGVGLIEVDLKIPPRWRHLDFMRACHQMKWLSIIKSAQ